MLDYHKDLVAYHDDRVTLRECDRAEMRQRRNANRKRLRSGLRRIMAPMPRELRSQGSYAMRTMIQDVSNDYDIDDGVYFDKDDLIGPRGAELSPIAAKQLVRNALMDSRFARQPEVRTNCVRIHYQEGYHVDMPVYRRFSQVLGWKGSETLFELAGSTWKRSDPLEVTRWFQRESARLSTNLDTDGNQLRRVVRLLKAFSRSRDSWQPRTASGFMITKLVVDCFSACAGRDDLALFRTMNAIQWRLKLIPVVEHPTMLGETLMRDPADARTRFLRERLRWATEQLRPLFSRPCSRSEALRTWDRVLATKFFSGRLGLVAACMSSAAPRISLVQEVVWKQKGSRPVGNRNPLVAACANQGVPLTSLVPGRVRKQEGSRPAMNRRQTGR